DTVAIGADRSLPIALRNSRSMNALLKFFRDLLVTLAAGERHIEFEDRRLRIFGVEDVMAAMTIGANGGFFRSIRDGMSVDALLIRGDHLDTEAIFFHHKLLAMTRAASRGNVGVRDAGLGICSRQELVRASMTIHTGCCVCVASLHGFSVETLVVRRLLVGVAGCT